MSSLTKAADQRALALLAVLEVCQGVTNVVAEQRMGSNWDSNLSFFLSFFFFFLAGFVLVPDEPELKRQKVLIQRSILKVRMVLPYPLPAASKAREPVTAYS